MIRWISPRLGTAPATSTELGEDVTMLDVRDLVDKFGNDLTAVRAKIDAGVALLRADATQKLVVCCDYGISRSNSIAVGILSLVDAIPFDEALQRVVTATGEREIKLEPLNAVRTALHDADDTSPASDAPRVLITGASGFLGRYLTTALEDRLDVVVGAGSALDLTSGALALDTMVRKHGITQIVHLANPRVYTSNRAVGDTLTMLRNVLDVCRSSRTKLVFLSGWEVYSGYDAQRIVADESLPMRPKGPYGEAKMLAERLVEHHRMMHDLDCSILRSSPVYGTGTDKPKFLYNFIRAAQNGAAVIKTHRYANGVPMLDLLHVRDLIEFISQVVVAATPGDFNVGGGRLYSTAEIAEIVTAHAKASCKVELQDIGDSVANVLMDSRRARAVLGWAPKRSFEASLPEIFTQSEKV